MTIKLNKNHKLFTMYLVSFIAIFMIPFLIFSTSMYILTSNNLKKQLVENEISLLNNIETNALIKYTSYSNLAVKLAKNYLNYNIYKNTNVSIDYDPYAQYARSQNDLVTIFPEISSVYLYNPTTRNLMKNTAFQNLDTFEDISWLEYINSINGLSRQQWVYGRKEGIDTLIYPYNPNIYVIINVDMNKLYSQLFSNTKDHIFVTENSLVLWHQKASNEYASSVSIDNENAINPPENIIEHNGTSYYVIKEQTVISDRIFTILKPLEELLAPLHFIKTLIGIVIIFMVCMIVTACYLLANKLSLPLRKLVSTINHDSDKLNEIDILNEYITTLNEQNSTLQAQLTSTNIRSTEINLLRYLRNTPFPNSEEMIDSVFPADIQNFTIAAVKFNSVTTLSSVQDYASDINNTLLNFSNTISSFLFYIDNTTLSILLFSSVDAEEHDAAILLLFRALTSATAFSPVIAITKTVHSKELLHQQFLHSFKLLKYRLYTDSFIIQDKEYPSSYFDVSKEELRFLASISDRDFIKAEQALTEIIDQIGAAQPYPDIVISYFDMLNIKLKSIPASLGFAEEELIFRNFTEYEFEPSFNLNDIFALFLNYTNNLISGLNIKMTSKNSELINNIKKYIQENIENDLSLSIVSEYYRMTPQYLSMLFKQETGQNFVVFLTLAKIERGKELLASTELSIKEIADIIGYNDRSFFAAFKKHVGITPKEYRNLHTTKKS